MGGSPRDRGTRITENPRIPGNREATNPGFSEQRFAGLERAEAVRPLGGEVEVAPLVLPRRQDRDDLRRRLPGKPVQPLLVEVAEDDEIDPLPKQAQGKIPCLPYRERP